MDLFALTVSLIYAAISAIWILVSDQAVHAMVAPEHQATVQTLKGWGFVVVTAVVIYLLVSRRMRKHQRTETELRRARDTAEHANTVKASFLAAMSHELRTPLNAINGFSEAMSREVFGPIGNATYRQHAELINLSGKHLLALIDDLLDISRLDLDQLDVERVPLRLGPVANEACRLMRGRAEEKGLRLTYEADAGGDDLVLGDRVRLKQVLINLIGNAVRYANDGDVDVRLRKVDGHVAVEITDAGPGIDDHILANMRTPFAAHAGRNMQVAPRGAGLGLPLSHLLADRHDGRLEIETEIGHGTTARLVLPRLATDDGPAAA